MIDSDSGVFDFEQQFLLLEKSLYLTALSILRNPEDAKDAVQEAIYCAYRKRNSLKSTTAFKEWITKIVINESYKIFYKRKKFIDIDECDYFCFEFAKDSDLVFFDLISKLRKRTDKTIVILRFYHDFSLKQISELLKIPISTVKSRYYRALDKIKSEMEE